MRQLCDKTALLTGAAGGIGRALALELARAGVHIVAVDIDQAGLELLRPEIEARGVRYRHHQCDVADARAVAKVTADVRAAGGVDILINNAGITFHGRTEWMNGEQWDRVLAVNLHAAIQFTRELLPTLLVRDEAHILNVCSVLGLVALPRVCAYSTTKFALVGFTEGLRAEYGQQGIGVTALCPGLVDTNLFSSADYPVNLKGPKTPPDWMCTSPARVAKAAVRAIRTNKRQVVIEPLGHALVFMKRYTPTFLDWALHWGKGRISKRRLAEYGTNQPAETRSEVVVRAA